MRKAIVFLLLMLVGMQFSYAAVKKSKTQAKVKKVVVKKEVKCPVTGGKVDPATTKLKTHFKNKTH